MEDVNINIEQTSPELTKLDKFCSLSGSAIRLILMNNSPDYLQETKVS